MEHKPRFCHSCGAALVGEATFCASCGAKQPSVVPASAPAPAPVVTPEPAPAPAPAVTPEPAPAPALVAAPVAPPESTLVAKPTISKVGLIMGILALATTLLAALLVFLYGVALYGDVPNSRPLLLGFFSIQNVLITCIVPLVAILLVLTKNKKVAIVGFILAIASLACQFIVSVAYAICMPAGVDISKFGFILRLVNGEGLFLDLWRLLRYGVRGGPKAMAILLNICASLCYWLKNILAGVACLLAAKKK